MPDKGDNKRPAPKPEPKEDLRPIGHTTEQKDAGGKDGTVTRNR